jgi:hypothetical protein
MPRNAQTLRLGTAALQEVVLTITEPTTTTAQEGSHQHVAHIASQFRNQ